MKKDCKFWKQSIYIKRLLWKNYQTSHNSRCFRQSCSFYVTKIACTWFICSHWPFISGKTCNCKTICNYITKQKVIYTISSKSHIDDLAILLCTINTIPQNAFLNKLKVFFRIVAHYDKPSVSFITFIHLASILLR